VSGFEFVDKIVGGVVPRQFILSADLPLDAPATVPRWGDAPVTLGHILVHGTAETQRHAGHADIAREPIDGSVGLLTDSSNMSSDDPAWWRDYRDQVEQAAKAAG
jgi:hypothetical protein